MYPYVLQGDYQQYLPAVNLLNQMEESVLTDLHPMFSIILKPVSHRKPYFNMTENIGIN